MLPPLSSSLTSYGTLEYRESGRSGNTALFLLHGLAGDSTVFRAHYASFGAHHRVLAWNAPGYGGSRPMESDEPGAADYADALKALFDARGVERAHLLGCSWGSLIATAFASRYPKQAGALILAAPNAGAGALPKADRRRSFVERTVPLHMLGPVEMARRSAERLVAPGAREEVLDQLRALGEAITSRGFSSAAYMMSESDGLAQIRELSNPVLVLAGAEDAIAPAADHAAALAAAARNAELEVFQDCGHMLELEAPDRFKAAVLDFLARHRGL